MKKAIDTTEQKILQAARQVFINKGLDGARMQEIADVAGINKALLHYYFRSKQKLFDAIFEEAFFTFLPQIAEVLTSDMSFPRKIESVIDKYFEVLKANPFLPSFILHEINRNPEHMAEIMKEKGINPKILKPTLEAELKRNHLLPVTLEHLMASILSLVIMPFAARPLFQRIMFENDAVQYDRFLEERREYAKTFIINSITP